MVNEGSFMRKHVLFISGNARSLVANRGDLISEIVSLGHKVSAAVPVEDFLDNVYNLGIDIYPFKLGRARANPLGDIRTLVFLCRLMQRLKPDATFAYTIKPVVWGGVAAKLVGVPEHYSMIAGLGSVFSESQSWRSEILRRLVINLYRFGMLSSRKVFFQNPDDIQDFLTMGILNSQEKAVRVMGSGVSIDRFTRHPIPNGVPCFLFVARMLKEKGIAEFVNAAEKIRKKWPNVRFIAVGPYDPTLPHSVSIDDLSRWKSAGAVEFVGEVEDVRPWLEIASVFVLPSYYREGTPRSILEAMAVGRPVITTDSPGCRETVSNGVNGFLVRPRDSDDLARAMLRFLESPSLVSQMAEESYRKACKEYEVGSVNQVILKAMNLV